MSELVDKKERELIRTALDRTIVVEAAAGTGKTTELVNRIVAVLAGGHAKVDSIVAVTFTEKAAGELKLRMRAGLEEARQQSQAGSPRRKHLEDALARLEEARVGTIHGFCADLLRERSVEAEVDPRFETLTEADSERLYREAFDFWLQEKLENPPEGVRRSLRRSAGLSGSPPSAATSVASDAGPVGRLRRAGWQLAEWRDFPAPWRRDPFDRELRVDNMVRQLHAFADLSARCAKPEKDAFFEDTRRARKLSADIHATEAVRPRDYDGVEAALVDLPDWKFRRPRKGYGRQYGDGVSREEVLDAHQALYAALQDFARAVDADLAALLHVELGEAVKRYESLKQRTGRLDFVDLLIRTRDLIRDSEPVRREFQQRFTHIFVDEFQDTDPLQAEILLLLASSDPAVTAWRDVEPAPGKLFLVADPKQSIYRFRRADVGTYLEVKELLARRDACCVNLTTSFRSVPAIQHAVNTAFAPLMDGDRAAQQPQYVPLSPCRADPTGQPAVVALPVPRPYGKRSIAKYAIEASLPDAVAAFVQWLLQESGWTVSDREHPGGRVPLAAHHICLLLRRFDSFYVGDVTRGYVRALEARDIRHLLVGGRSFHEREEVETLRTALAAIEWPDDELSIFATLRGSLFAIDDESLLEYRHRFKRLHPFRIPKEFRVENEAVEKGDREEEARDRPAARSSARRGPAQKPAPERLLPIAAALELLASLHRHRNERPIAETINLLLETTRAHAGFVLRPSGEQVLANVLHVAEQARAYERAGGISFRGFVERLEDDAQGRKAAEAPILEEGSEGVRIMTVHKAKGLEFPVVILADVTANMTPSQASRWIDPVQRQCAQRIAGWSPAELLDHQQEELQRDRAEGVRIAYVAATRARDLLVVPAVGDGPWGDGSGWAAPLNTAIYPPKDGWSGATRAPGCPEFGDDSVLERPFELALDSRCVKPGLHSVPAGRTASGSHDPSSEPATRGSRSRAPDHHVVWWDPSTLNLDVPPNFGIRQEELLGKDVDSAVVESEARQHSDWLADRAATIDRAAMPSVRVRTATERAALLVKEAAQQSRGAEPEVELVELPIDPNRPAGPRFGALVHAVLATVSLDAARDQIRRITELQGRILGATSDELAAAEGLVEKALKHPLLKRARRAAERGQCRRETPVTLRESGGSLIEGVVDLAFLEDDTWTVVDFKTDRELEKGLTQYKHQVAIYARAIAAATGKSASAMLMRV